MNIAMLNEKVTFQKNEVVTDRIGNHTNAWTDYYTCSATISGENGREEQDAGARRQQPSQKTDTASFFMESSMTSSGSTISHIKKKH